MKTNGENQDLQRLMNARLWKCIEHYGGAQDISKATGLSPQTFYNMRDNRTFPSTPTISALKKVAPSLSFDAIYSEGESEEWRETNAAPTELKRLFSNSPADPDLKSRYEKLEQKFEDLTNRHTKLVNAVLKEKMGLELDFLRASSQTTAYTPIGFVQQLRLKGTDYTKSDRPMIVPDIRQGWPCRLRK